MTTNDKNGQSERAQMRRYRVLQSVLAGASERQIAEQEGVFTEIRKR